MKKVFVFCIGGTGLRVMKSIAMLMAGGMSTNGYTVIPIIIDPHLGLEERGHLNNLLDNYQAVYRNTIKIEGGNGGVLPSIDGFFNSPILRLHELDQKNASYEDGSYGADFKQYIQLQQLANDDINKHLVNMLFSSKNLNNKLDEGFRGNPNVGTVVLGNIIQDSEWYDAFIRHCEQGDRAFIISSIFGGTGASGFPLLEKKIKLSDNPNVKNITLGAVTVLPYYGLRDPESSNSNIDSKNFYTKTKAALSYYYNHTLSDYLYYSGETHLKAVYDNNEAEQKDAANFVELNAASALFDFLNQSANPQAQQFMSRRIAHDEASLSLEDMGKGFCDIVKCVADFALLSKLSSILKEEKRFPLSKSRGWNQNFYDDNPFRSLMSLIGLFDNWYNELANNNRAFAPLRTGKGIHDRWIEGTTLDAKDDSWYLLKMIQKGNKDKVAHGNTFRHFMQTVYYSINYYTQKIK